MDKLQAIPIISILVFIIITMIIGILPYGRKRINSAEAFHTATGGVSTTALILCMMATVYTSSTWTAWVSLTAELGVFCAYVIVYIAATGVIYYNISQRIYPVGREISMLTLGKYLELRYDSRRLSLIVAVISIGIGAIWIIMEIKTLGYVMDIAFGGKLNPSAGAILGIAVVLVYILWGGLESVIWTSCLQGFIVTAGGVLLTVVLVKFNFPTAGAFGQALMDNGELLMTGRSGGPPATIQQWISVSVCGSAGCICLPQIFHRMSMGKSVSMQKKVGIAIIVSAVWCVSFILIGFLALVLQIQEVDSQSLIFTLVLMPENYYVSSFTYILLIAAAMGTLDITLLSVSTILTVDIFGNLFQKYQIRVSQYNYLVISRMIIIGIAFICGAIAIMDNRTIISFAFQSYEIIAQIFPILIYGCYARRRNANVAVISLIAGLSTVAAVDWIFGWAPFGFDAGMWGIMINSAIIILYEIFRSRKISADGL